MEVKSDRSAGIKNDKKSEKNNQIKMIKCFSMNLDILSSFTSVGNN